MAETSKIKNPGLEMVFMRPNVEEPIDNFKEVSALYVNDHKGKKHYVPTKKIVLYHGTPASELEGGQFDVNRFGNQGTDWLLGTHATPDISIAKGYYEDGGSVFRVGFDIDKMWNLTGDNKISSKMLSEYTEIAKKKDAHPEDAILRFKERGVMSYMDRGEKRDFLMKHGYNLVLDGSKRVVMLNPVDAGTSPVRLTDKEVELAGVRRKKSDKYLSAYYNLAANRRISQQKRTDIDKAYKEQSLDRQTEQLMASFKKTQDRIKELRSR